MKSFFPLLIGIFITISAISQDIPQVQLKTLTGKTVNTKDIIKNNGKPVVVCFWATWCKPCIKELTAYNEQYSDWVKETGVKIIAISIDDSRSTSRVAPFVNGKDWEFEVYLDPNSDFKRAMNVGDIPHTFVLDKDGKVVWQHKSYMEGDEKKLQSTLKNVVTGQPIK